MGRHPTRLPGSGTRGATPRRSFSRGTAVRPETTAYLRHHTKLAGRSDQLSSDDAADLIHQAGRGFPRAVSRLAAAALLATCTTHKTIADTTAVRAAITEVNDQ